MKASCDVALRLLSMPPGCEEASSAAALGLASGSCGPQLDVKSWWHWDFEGAAVSEIMPWFPSHKNKPKHKKCSSTPGPWVRPNVIFCVRAVLRSQSVKTHVRKPRWYLRLSCWKQRFRLATQAIISVGSYHNALYRKCGEPTYANRILRFPSPLWFPFNNQALDLEGSSLEELVPTAQTWTLQSYVLWAHWWSGLILLLEAVDLVRGTGKHINPSI